MKILTEQRPRAPLLILCALLLLLSSGCALAFGDGPRDFKSDGCSLFLDGTLRNQSKWCDCCLQHDIAYWRGGTEAERKKADEALRDCVLERTKDKVLAETMYRGVRAGGHPAFPIWYRWAYGWDYGRGYEPLTKDEQKQVREKLDLYWRDHPDGYCGENHPNK